MARALLVRIEGVVQGVGFRYWTMREAQARGLRGWVRNRLDGSVEALIAGADGDIDEMLALLRQGPADSRVTRVSSGAAAVPPEAGFHKRPTA